jgi:serine/threonine protein kinase
MKVLTWSDPKLIELMQREASALQIIQHPSIPKATIDDYFTFTVDCSSAELHCLIMEKIAGQNLEHWLEVQGRISQNLALNWLKQLVEILDKVHHSGFFHRDIKPSNIILQPNSQLALIDFGAVREVTNTYLAKVSGSGGTNTGLGSKHEITAIRTARYSPLEQINGQAVPQSDFYSLGRTFAYLVTGVSLINLPTDPQTGKLLWRNKAPQIDRPFADLLDEMMAPFPGQRPQTTQVILQRLEQIPFKLKVHRLFKSNWLRLTLISLITALVLISYQTINLSISNHYFNLASRNQERPEIAKNYYELAIKFNPNDVDAYNNLALTCQQLNDSKCVIETYQKAFLLKPNNWEGHYGLGSFYDDRGKYDLAEQQYKMAVQIDRDRAVGAINNLSRLRNINGEYNAAIKLAQQGLSKTQVPDSQAALYKNLGWAKFGQKRYLEAKNHLQKSLQLDPQRVDAYCLLAQTQEALGESAQLSWEVCLLASSDLPEVQEWRQRVLQRLWQR